MVASVVARSDTGLCSDECDVIQRTPTARHEIEGVSQNVRMCSSPQGTSQGRSIIVCSIPKALLCDNLV